MALPWCRVLIVFIVAVSDISMYVYENYFSGSNQQVPIGYTAHISGALTGLLVGILCLRNLRWETHEEYIWAISACIFGILTGTAIIYSIAVPTHFVGIRNTTEIECISDGSII